MDMWALDFIRAVNERPAWAKFILRLVIGKYAYAEFLGIIWALDKKGYYPFWDYGCEGMDYHEKKLPRVWWGKVFDMGKENNVHEV